MDAWERLLLDSGAPNGSDAWEHLVSQNLGVGGNGTLIVIETSISVLGAAVETIIDGSTYFADVEVLDFAIEKDEDISTYVVPMN